MGGEDITITFLIGLMPQGSILSGALEGMNADSLDVYAGRSQSSIPFM
jgi:hypothetical protein